MIEKNFDPRGKGLYSLFDCQEKSECPISQLSIEYIRALTKPEAHSNHCVGLAWRILNDKVRAIEIGLMRCGHYSVSDGRHRICIARKLGITLPANVEICMNDDCEMCEPTEECGEDVFIIEVRKI